MSFLGWYMNHGRVRNHFCVARCVRNQSMILQGLLAKYVGYVTEHKYNVLFTSGFFLILTKSNV